MTNRSSEIRGSVSSEYCTIVAPERAERPNQYSEPTIQEACPFCPGNEHLTPQTRLVLPKQGNWQVRAVSNRYPALRIEGESEYVYDPLHFGTILNVHGAHEVIIEHPDHDRNYTGLQPGEFEFIFQAIMTQINDLYLDQKIKFILVVKNFGKEAGASIDHDHCQLFGLPRIPPNILQRFHRFEDYLQTNGKSSFDQMDERSRKDKRILLETDHFICIAPYEARFPFEHWFLPKGFVSNFSVTNFSDSSPHFYELGGIFLTFFRKLSTAFNGKLPAFNGILLDAPPKSQRDCTGYFRWCYKVLPRLTNISGFELETNMFINPTSPEKSVEFLSDEH